MCSLKRFALANIAAGFAVAAFGCAAPVEDTAEVSSADGIQPNNQADQADPQGQPGNQPAQANQPGQPGQPGQQPGQPGEPGGPGAPIGPIGFGAPVIPGGVVPGIIDPAAIFQGVAQMNEAIRAQVQENILRQRVQMLMMMRQIFAGLQGGPGFMLGVPGGVGIPGFVGIPGGVQGIPGFQPGIFGGVPAIPGFQGVPGGVQGIPGVQQGTPEQGAPQQAGQQGTPGAQGQQQPQGQGQQNP